MKTLGWAGRLAAIFGVAVAAAVAAAALPDHPYQRWQLVENTLYSNATWSYERIHFDPRPIDVAILGSSRAQLGLSAPLIAERLAARGLPLAVANLAVIEDGRNLQWAIVDELVRTKRPKTIVLTIAATVHPWGHPGFRYVAPAGAVAAPRAWLLHNAKDDIPYLPYRQLFLAGAAMAPRWFALRDHFDPALFAAKPDDYTVSRQLADGKFIDMDRTVAADNLRAERVAFTATQRPSRVPLWIARVTDRDEYVYVDAISRLAAAHGIRVIFLFLPEFEDASVIAGRSFYAARGTLVDAGDLARDPTLFQSFAHLNHRGAIIASDRVAAAVAAVLPAGRATG